jgi:hypothetical protein
MTQPAWMSPQPSSAVTAPWPAGLAEAGQPQTEHVGPDGHAVYKTAYVKPTELLTLAEVRFAVEHLLGRYQARQAVSWRTEEWFGEEDAQRAITLSRSVVAYNPPPRDEPRPTPTLRPATPPPIPLTDAALDAVVAAFTIPPKALITALSRLGVIAKTATDADYYVAFTLLDHYNNDDQWFDLIRLSGITVANIPRLRTMLGTERLDLLLRLDWDASAIMNATADPDRLSLDALRTMVALYTGKPA